MSDPGSNPAAPDGAPQQHAGWGIALRCGAMLGFAIVSAQAKWIGVMIMATPEPGNFNLLGVSFALASAVGAAGAMVAIRQISSTETGPTIVFYYTLMGMAVGALGSMFHWVTPDLETLAMLAAIGVTGGVAQMLLTEALRKASIGIVAPFDYTQLIWAALIGLVFWDEHLRAVTLFGALLVAGSGGYILHFELMKFRKG